jgi:phosphate-selective porin OprO and OprP
LQGFNVREANVTDASFKDDTKLVITTDPIIQRQEMPASLCVPVGTDCVGQGLNGAGHHPARMDQGTSSKTSWFLFKERRFMNGKLLCAIGGGLLLSLAGVVHADQTTTSDADRIKALEAKVAELQGQSWLSERQTEEVKSLVKDVIADANTRPSLVGTNATAGRNDTAFFIANDENTFLLQFRGQIDVRYMANFRQGIKAGSSSPLAGPGLPSGIDSVVPNGFDSSVGAGESSINKGFEITRAKIEFFGHIADPRIMYDIRLAVDPDHNDVTADTITISYKFWDGKMTVWAGEDKATFLRETLTQSYNQLAVERSFINYIFTVGAAQGIGLVWVPNDAVKAQLMINDGFRSGESGSLTPTQFEDDFTDDSFVFNDKFFTEGRADIAVTGRVDIKVAGQWVDEDDFAAWPDRPFSAFIGGAFHYEVGRTGDAARNNNFFEWTLDGSAKYQGLGFFAAVMGMHTMYDHNITPPTGSTGDDSLYGGVAQASWNVNSQFEPFIRYEVFVSQSLRQKAANGGIPALLPQDTINLVTVGANWYNKKHSAKGTLDMVWALNELPPALFILVDPTGRNTGLLPDAAGHKNQLVVRLQYQLLF